MNRLQDRRGVESGFVRKGTGPGPSRVWTTDSVTNFLFTGWGGCHSLYSPPLGVRLPSLNRHQSTLRSVCWTITRQVYPKYPFRTASFLPVSGILKSRLSLWHRKEWRGSLHSGTGGVSWRWTRGKVPPRLPVDSSSPPPPPVPPAPVASGVSTTPYPPSTSDPTVSPTPVHLRSDFWTREL